MHANPMDLKDAARAAPWYRHRWPWFLMIGPALVLVGGVIMTWLALSRPDAMVVGDYYKQGKAINQELRRDRVASRMALVFEATYDAAGGRLLGRLSSHGVPVAAPFHIRLAHPTQPRKDRVLEALPDAHGRFAAQAGRLEATHWQVVVEGDAPGDAPGDAQGDALGDALGDARNWRLARSWSWPKEARLVIEADAQVRP